MLFFSLEIIFHRANEGEGNLSYDDIESIFSNPISNIILNTFILHEGNF